MQEKVYYNMKTDDIIINIVLTSKSWITKVFTQLKAGSRNFICDSILDDGTIVLYDGTRI